MVRTPHGRPATDAEVEMFDINSSQQVFHHFLKIDYRKAYVLKVPYSHAVRTGDQGQPVILGMIAPVNLSMAGLVAGDNQQIVLFVDKMLNLSHRV